MAKMTRAEIQKQMDVNRGRIINDKKVKEIKAAIEKPVKRQNTKKYV